MCSLNCTTIMISNKSCPVKSIRLFIFFKKKVFMKLKAYSVHILETFGYILLKQICIIKKKNKAVIKKKREIESK